MVDNPKEAESVSKQTLKLGFSLLLGKLNNLKILQTIKITDVKLLTVKEKI